MVGNGCTNWTYDALPGTVDMGYWRSLYSTDTYDQIQMEQCDYSGVEFDHNPSDSCMSYLDEVNTAIAGLNIYNIYGKCYGGAPTEIRADEKLVDNEGYLLESRRLEENSP